jgi:FtsH Extracellular.
MFKDFKKIQIKMPKKFSVWHIVIAFGFFILLQMYLMNPGVRDITYSEFKKQVKDGNVVECHISHMVIRGKLREMERGTTKNAIFVTARVEDPDLVKDLESMGVRYAGHYESSWLKDVLFLLGHAAADPVSYLALCI